MTQEYDPRKNIMAIDRKIYINEVDIGLKANEDYKKFYFNFKINSKIYSKLFDYSKTDWDKRTRIAKAKVESIAFKNNKVNPKTELDENIKFEVFIKMHFDNLPNTAWTATKKKHYEKYIKKYIGNKKVTSIKQMHIKDCIKFQEYEGLAPRTVKTTLELLNPVFKEAIANRLIDFNPCTGISVKVPKTKKTVLMTIGETAKVRIDTEPLILSENPNTETLFKEVSLAKGFRLKPNEYLYANTIEYVKIPKNMCALLLPRSTFARLGLILPISQYANPSYEGNLPIIIYNASRVEVEIPPYYKVMQMLLLKVDGEAKEYKKQIDAKYFKETNIPNPQLDKDYDLEKILKELNK